MAAGKLIRQRRKAKRNGKSRRSANTTVNRGPTGFPDRNTTKMKVSVSETLFDSAAPNTIQHVITSLCQLDNFFGRVTNSFPQWNNFYGKYIVWGVMVNLEFNLTLGNACRIGVQIKDTNSAEADFDAIIERPYVRVGNLNNNGGRALHKLRMSMTSKKIHGLKQLTTVNEPYVTTAGADADLPYFLHISMINDANPVPDNTRITVNGTVVFLVTWFDRLQL